MKAGGGAEVKLSSKRPVLLGLRYVLCCPKFVAPHSSLVKETKQVCEQE